MKVRLHFKEVVDYEVTIDVDPGVRSDDDVIEDLESCDDDGEPLWFHVLEEQNPDWYRNRVAGIEERELVGPPKVVR